MTQALLEDPKNEGVRPVVYDLIARLEEFGAFSRRMRGAILNWAEWVLTIKHDLIIDKNNADEILAFAVYGVRQDYSDLTAEEYYELEEWTGFLGDVYDAYWRKRNQPRRGRPSKRQDDHWHFSRFPSDLPDILPDWSTVPCVVTEDAE